MAYVVADLPDNVTAASMALAVNASGLAHVRTTVLLTADEGDAAGQKTPKYAPPGQ